MRLTKNVVIDTNVFVSAFLKEDSLPRMVIDQIIDDPHSVILISEETITELKYSVFNDKFNKYVSNKVRLAFLDSVLSKSSLTLAEEHITDCRDLRDNKFLEVAVSGNADKIITGDNDLLILNPYRNIEIITPRDFLEAERKAA